MNNLRSIKQLAINAANDTNTDQDRMIIQKNVDQRLLEIDDIAATTTVLRNCSPPRLITLLKR